MKTFSGWFVYQILAISPDTLLGGALNFFIYDTIKIFL
ncbi:MAG: permease, partial [Candidatus Omnitrophica bacterium]|nr:permease [Candidatus Omnitrophota bacterium]